MSDIELKVGGKIYSGWTAMRSRRSLEHAAGAFTLQLTERWPGQPQRWAIQPGTACQLLLNGAPIITGFADRVERSLDASAHSIRVTGRDKTADVGDCSPCLGDDCGTANLTGQTLEKAVTLLCQPYGIAVLNKVGELPRLRDINVNPVGTIWEALAAAAKQCGVYLMSDGLGSFIITRACTERHPARLVQGENILSARFDRDDSDRFWRYIGLSDYPADGGLDFYGKDCLGREVALDDAARAPRTTTFPSEALEGLSLSDHTNLLLRHRRAVSRRLVVGVQGWSAGGQIWKPNEMVSVSLPLWGLDNVSLLIVAVEQTLDRGGCITELTLSPREAYDLPVRGQPEPDSDLPPEARALLN